MLVERHRRPPGPGILAGMGRDPLALVEDADQTDRAEHIDVPANQPGLILDSRVLTEEPRGATIGPMSDSRSCLPSKGFGCCDGRHCPSTGTNHGFAADNQSDLLDR